MSRIEPTGAQAAPMLCVSIHDVAPATWSDCLRLVQAVREVADIPLTWLVVPHYHFRPERSLAMDACLKVVVERGDELALHGYSHLDTAANGGGLRGRFLRNVYTRREGEFAALDEAESRHRLEQGLAWFAERGWTPSGFIPPAWLLGKGAWRALRASNFAYTTTFSHFHCLRGHDGSPQERAVLSPSLVYAARNRGGRLLSPRVADATAAMLANAPLVRFSLHPPDARYPELVRHTQRVLERLLAQREAVTKAECARRLMRAPAQDGAPSDAARMDDKKVVLPIAEHPAPVPVSGASAGMPDAGLATAGAGSGDVAGNDAVRAGADRADATGADVDRADVDRAEAADTDVARADSARADGARADGARAEDTAGVDSAGTGAASIEAADADVASVDKAAIDGASIAPVKDHVPHGVATGDAVVAATVAAIDERHGSAAPAGEDLADERAATTRAVAETDAAATAPAHASAPAANAAAAYVAGSSALTGSAPAESSPAASSPDAAPASAAPGTADAAHPQPIDFRNRHRVVPTFASRPGAGSRARLTSTAPSSPSARFPSRSTDKERSAASRPVR